MHSPSPQNPMPSWLFSTFTSLPSSHPLRKLAPHDNSFVTTILSSKSPAQVIEDEQAVLMSIDDIFAPPQAATSLVSQDVATLEAAAEALGGSSSSSFDINVLREISPSAIPFCSPGPSTRSPQMLLGRDLRNEPRPLVFFESVDHSPLLPYYSSSVMDGSSPPRESLPCFEVDSTDWIPLAVERRHAAPPFDSPQLFSTPKTHFLTARRQSSLLPMPQIDFLDKMHLVNEDCDYMESVIAVDHSAPPRSQALHCLESPRHMAALPVEDYLDFSKLYASTPSPQPRQSMRSAQVEQIFPDARTPVRPLAIPAQSPQGPKFGLNLQHTDPSLVAQLSPGNYQSSTPPAPFIPAVELCTPPRRSQPAPFSRPFRRDPHQQSPAPQPTRKRDRYAEDLTALAERLDSPLPEPQLLFKKANPVWQRLDHALFGPPPVPRPRPATGTANLEAIDFRLTEEGAEFDEGTLAQDLDAGTGGVGEAFPMEGLSEDGDDGSVRSWNDADSRDLSALLEG